MIYSAIEAASRDERAALQLERLRSTAARRGLEVSSLDDLQSLPFTTKDDLRASYPLGLLAVPRERLVRIHASSGTGGKPTIVAYTAGDVALFAEVNARAIACAGGRAGDVFQIAYGYGLFTGGLGLHYGGERLGATVVPASGGNVPLQLGLLADLCADGIACTPSFALLLAERAGELRERIRLRYGVLGAEAWSEEIRRELEAAWGFDACDIYGLSEVIGPGVAMECREGKGALHVFDDHFLPEIVDGELVLTTLSRAASPVLRFRTGDVTSFVDEPCPCGRTHRRIARLSGRLDDMLVVRGINVYPSEIEAVVLEDTALAPQYAIVVDRRRTLVELEVHAELRAAADREAVRARLAERLEVRLRVRVAAFVGEPGSIPRQEVGKARRVWERTGEEDPFR